MDTTSDHTKKSKTISTYENATIIESSKDEINNYYSMKDKVKMNADL
jgi:hypothetical protein